MSSTPTPHRYAFGLFWSVYGWFSNFINTHIGEEYNQGGDIISNLDNEKRYIKQRTTETQSTTSNPTNGVYTMVFNMEVDAYVKKKYTIEDNIQKP